MAGTTDADIQAQLTKLTSAVQIISDFSKSSSDSITNPEGGVIRTLHGLNKAFDDALPQFSGITEAVNEAKDAKDDAKAAQTAAEQAAAQAGSASLSPIYKSAVVAPGTTVSLPVAPNGILELTLNAATTTINLGAVTDAAGVGRAITIILKQGTGSNKVTWDSKIKWANDREPVLSYLVGYEDIITLITTNSGAKWRGLFNGGWINNA